MRQLLIPDSEKLHEECGVIGVYAPGLDVSRLAFYGLYALQHRGQESAGIAVANGEEIILHKGMGLVPDVLGERELESLHGDLAIGHVRYSTTGASQPINAQPLVFRYAGGMIGLGHNGNLTNAAVLRDRLASSGTIFQSTTDTEIIVNMIARYYQTSLVNAIIKCMVSLEGAYSLVIMTEDQLFAVRDPFGFRPLCLGVLDDHGFVVASESCALDTIGAKLIRDVLPGEIVTIDHRGLTSIRGQNLGRCAHCIFEYIYFARPDSCIDGFHVNQVRREMGRQLAREYPVKADLVIPVPDSGNAAARGYAEGLDVPFEEGLMKNRYIGRTFIQPTQDVRDLSVRLKINPVKRILSGKKRVVMVDDSLVRGTTSGRMVKLLRDCGVEEVHLCLSSPPVTHSCYYGIDISDDAELVAAHKPVEEIRKMIGADGLHYLSIEGLLQIFGESSKNFCTACYSGDYPVGDFNSVRPGKNDLEKKHKKGNMDQ
ncbi:MAG TPA: amidophosphoribosyltransferase [Desulfotomaculum sp.]|nr:MAG: Amidophosphoribosyltransferase [Desulfofundulus kuznetsovii]HAG10749.1 amidophosphoribosyltransferase [Desulfotomaculum sp.]HBY03920.1 amidophosphoribosyltransferase [Desulfotomaculum sp.]